MCSYLVKIMPFTFSNARTSSSAAIFLLLSRCEAVNQSKIGTVISVRHLLPKASNPNSSMRMCCEFEFDVGIHSSTSMCHCGFGMVSTGLGGFKILQVLRFKLMFLPHLFKLSHSSGLTNLHVNLCCIHP